MSALRRRILGDRSNEPSRTPSPADPARLLGAQHDERRRNSEPSAQDSSTVAVPLDKLERINQHLKSKTKSSKRRNAWIFGLGGLFGIIVAGFFVGQSEVIDLSAFSHMHLESLLDVLPAALVKDAQEIQKSERDAIAYDSFVVGLEAQSQGITAEHPVIMIPGVISTALESWGTAEQSRQYFRKRLWGSWTMMRALVMDKPNWKKHIALDKHTGLDPPGVKLRAAQGFDAADFFITGYWIWNKILENLATIGYDPSNAFTAAYDWRLSYSNLEVRDQYYSRLKAYIEMVVRTRGKKAVLLSHSMGSQVLFYFFHWAEAEGYGNGGPSWVDDHVDSWINISGCMLGALKGIPAVLSGEMKDTAQLNAFAVYGLEKFLSRHERAEIFRSMPGISSMLPMGGNTIWGDHSGAPDDRPEQSTTFGNFITFREPVSGLAGSASSHAKNLTVGDSLPYLFNHSEPWYRDAVVSNYSHGIAHTRHEVEENELNPIKWTNPLESRLPLAPNLKIYCFYGVGKPTERAYFYRPDVDPSTRTNVTIDTAYSSPSPPHPPDNATADDITGRDDAPADHGVVMGEGDGTVNLMSMGYMCSKGWRGIRRYNPAGAKVTVHEMLHEPDRFNPRGGPNTGDHVDILGRRGLNELILKVAGGKGDGVDEVVHSNIKEYAERVKIFDDEEEGGDVEG